MVNKLIIKRFIERLYNTAGNILKHVSWGSDANIHNGRTNYLETEENIYRNYMETNQIISKNNLK